jgi:hypothetical protein
MLTPLKTFSLGDALGIIGEWQPQNFARLDGFQLCLLLGLAFALYRGLSLPPVRLLVLIGLLHLSLAQSRHTLLLAVLLPLFLADPLKRQVASAASVLQVSWPVLATTCLVVALASTLTASRALAPDPGNSPNAAIAATGLADRGPVLNDYAFGAYLIHAGIAPFIDGRGEIFGRGLLLRHHRGVTLQDVPDFLRLLEEYRIGATLLHPATPAVALLDRLPEWKRIYADDYAVVHQRVTAP